MELAIEIVAGVVIGMSLGLLGAGGSILLVPVFHYLLGDSAKAAIFQSLAVVFAIAAFAGTNAARRRQVDVRSAVLMALPGMAGAVAGAAIARSLAETVQMVLFATVMGIAAWRILRGTLPAEGAAPPSVAKAGATGLGVGVLTGIVGVGGGFLIVPALTLVLGVPIRLAIGTSLVVIALNSVAALGKLWIDLPPAVAAEVDLRTMAIVALFGIGGSVAGAALGTRLNQALLRKIFGWFLVAVCLLVLADYAWPTAKDVPENAPLDAP